MINLRTLLVDKLLHNERRSSNVYVTLEPISNFVYLKLAANLWRKKNKKNKCFAATEIKVCCHLASAGNFSDLGWLCKEREETEREAAAEILMETARCRENMLIIII